jgi:ketosteroid isomerase-like protein
MESIEDRNIAVVRRYYEGCNSGDLAVLQGTLTEDVVHYFLSHTFPTVRGAEHLARFWRKFQVVLRPVWRIDEIIAHGDRVVSEWSCLWEPGEGARVMSRGTEWYILRDGRIAEVRAYFQATEIADSELVDFPYVGRGYLMRPGVR